MWIHSYSNSTVLIKFLIGRLTTYFSSVTAPFEVVVRLVTHPVNDAVAISSTRSVDFLSRFISCKDFLIRSG